MHEKLLFLLRSGDRGLVGLVLLIHDICYSINLDAMPLSLYYFSVGHKRT